MSFHLSIITATLLALTVAAHAQRARSYSAVVAPAYAPPRGGMVAAPHLSSTRADGFTGSFSASQVSRTLGY